MRLLSLECPLLIQQILLLLKLSYPLPLFWGFGLGKDPEAPYHGVVDLGVVDASAEIIGGL